MAKKSVNLVLTTANDDGSQEEPLQASSSSGRLHKIVVMRAGPSTVIHPASKLPVYFPWEVISRDGPSVFEGAQATGGHNPANPSDPTVVNGVVKDVYPDPDTQELRATYICLDDDVQRKVVAAKEEGVLDKFFEFSMKTPAETHREVIDGKQYEVADRLIKFVHTRVDTVTKGAAGGRFVLAAAATSGDETLNMSWKTFKTQQPELAKKLLDKPSVGDAISEIGTIEGLEADGNFYGEFSTEYVETHLQKAEVKSDPVEPKPEPVEPVEPVTTAQPALEAAERAERALAEIRKLQAETKLSTSGLSEKDQEYIRTSVLEAASPEEVDSVINKHKDYIKNTQSVPTMATSGSRDSYLLQASITAGDDAFDVFRQRCEGMFAGRSLRLETGSKTIVPRFRNYREMAENHPTNPVPRDLPAPELMASAHVWYKGSERGATILRGPDRHKVSLLEAAAATTTHTEIFADVLHKRMITTYHSGTEVEEVRALASQNIEVEDFKNYKFISLAEYSNPSSVAEGGTYGSLTTPADIQEQQGVTKYGFIETVTMEALLDPDGKAFLMLPQRMGQAMKRLERHTYLNAITTDNANMGHDTTTLYHANHSNTNTLALTLTNLATSSVAMQKQAARGSSERYGSRLRPWAILIPIDLEDLVDRIINPTGFEMGLTAPGASTELNKGAYSGLRKVVLSHQTDVNNWYLMAKPLSAGLDGVDTFATLRLRGVNEPEFFTQDSEDSESMFGSDKINWKVRDFFGVKPLDERSFYRNVV